MILAAPARNLFAQACNPASLDVGGVVFADYDLDGTRDANEPAQRGDGLVINAYDCANALLASAPVATNGVYRLAGIGSAQGVRLELANLPAWLVESRAGTHSRTSVRFVTGGDCAVDFGVAQPSDFSGANTPNVLATCFVEGPFGGASAGLPALVRFPFTASGTNHQETVVATHATIGSTYGLAWQRGRQRIYAGAFYKRFTGIGPGGTDAIYVLTANGAWQGTINLGSLPGGAGAGADAHDFSVAQGENDIRDTASHSLVGKRGLGDVEISDDDRTLYVVNLFNRRIYQLDVSAGDAALASITASWPAPDGCGNGTHRPLGLGWHKGKLWVGSVCENASNGFVHSLNPATGVFTLELTVPLTYTREVVAQSSANTPPQPAPVSATWRPWSDNPADLFYTATGASGPYEIAWPQPMLSDIEFDGEDMILGFRDRFGDQSGNEALQVPVGSATVDKPATRLYTGNAAGDILRVCRTPAGPWALETGLTGACAPAHGPLGPLPNSGPGGHEYYYWDFYYLPYNFLPAANPFPFNPATPGNTNNNYHLETTMGGLLQIAGAGHVMTTAVDPMLSFSGGILRLDNRTGSRWGVSADDVAQTQAEFDAGGLMLYLTYRGSINRPEQIQTFGKANGLGDLEAMLPVPPLQIGNRVFRDLDADGIQDPCDPPIASVAVLLYSNNVQIASTSTDPAGEYYFTVQPNSSYQVRVALAQAPLTGLVPTRREVASGTERHDSDGNPVPAPGFVVTTVTTGAPGHNDHVYDFGFTPSACIGDTVWFDRNQDGLQSGGAENGVSGVRVYLRDAVGRIATNTTNGAGFYQFCDLLPGDYCVEFDLPSRPSGTAVTTLGPAGSGDPSDSDANPTTGKTEFTTLVPGENDPTWDLGVICLPPVLTCPPDATLDCPADTTPGNTGTATATSPCGCALTVTFSDVTTPGCGVTRTIARTWTAQDECGNRSTCVQTIQVRDLVPPVIANAPANASVACDAVPNAPQVAASDLCDGPVTPQFSQTLTPGVCPQTYSLSRTWTATDACGNRATATQVLSVSDTLAPALTGVPAAVTLDCPAQPAVPVVTAADACDLVVPVGFTELVTPGACPGRFTLTRTWSASDDCGNTTNAVQVITIRDITPPVLTGVPAAQNAECPNLPAPPVVTAADTCDPSVPVGLVEAITPGACPGRYVLTRTWTALDDCGNQVQQSQDITVTDVTSPVLSGVPANQTVACDAVPTPPVVTAADACDPTVPVTFNEVRTPGACTNSYILTRTWSAADDCLNPATAVQIITVRDLAAPTLVGVPGDVTVECPNVPAAAVVTAVDTCDPSVPVTFTEIRTPGACTNSYLLTRTWTAEDDCLNRAVAVQVVTVRDTTAPVLSGAPADMTVECDAVPAAPVLTAADACDADVPVVFSQTLAAGACPQSYTITRSWRADDDCLNRAAHTQVVTVRDTRPPVLSATPADATVECDAVPAAPVLTALDACDAAVPVTFAQTLAAGPCPQSYAITRTWTAEDDCLNRAVITQVVTVRDTVPPALPAAPADALVSCESVPPAVTLAASDVCDTAVPVIFTEQRANGTCPNRYTLTRTWTATDDCGNTTNRVQVVTVTDLLAPTLTGVPADATVPCTAVPAPPTVTAADLCDAAPSVIFSSTTLPGLGEGDYTLRRTWTATDSCGNQRVQTQVLRVVDTVAPDLQNIPGNLDLLCVAIPAPPLVSALDNCDTTPTVTLVETSLTNGVRRTWTAVDDSGNSSSASQTITVTCNVAIGNLVWKDSNGDGVAQPGENGIPGVLVQLYPESQTPGVGAPLRSMQTDTNGRYRFDGLAPGCYRVYIPTPPADCPVSTGPTDTADNREDNDDNGTQAASGAPVVSPLVCLGAGQEPTADGDGPDGDLTVDFGFYAPVRVGDFAWEDLNGDGCQDAGEPGIPGVPVRLFNAANNLQVGSTTTGPDGRYLFSGLPPGSYYSDFDMPSGCVISPRNSKADDARDSDADASGITAPTPFLVSGAENLTLDAGCYRPACLGDTVWADLNNDGVPQENLASVGFPGVTVNLYRVTPGGNVFVRSTATASVPGNLGYYEFCGLAPGTYVVAVNTGGVPPSYTLVTTPVQYTVTLRSGDFSRIHDFGFNAASTAVELVSFTAEPSPAGVLVRWETGSETENFGFQLHRSATPEGARVLVTPDLVEASGAAAGSAYAFLDLGVAPGRHYYWLEDLEYSGDTTLHGPVEVLVPAEAAPLPLVDAVPVPGASVFLREAAQCRTPWVVPESGNWLLRGFAAVPEILDVSNPALPVLLRGEALETSEGAAVYLHLPAGRRVGARGAPAQP